MSELRLPLVDNLQLQPVTDDELVEVLRRALAGASGGMSTREMSCGLASVGAVYLVDALERAGMVVVRDK